MKTVLFAIIAALMCACVLAHREGHGGPGNHHGGNGPQPNGGRPHWNPEEYMARFQRECAADQARLCPELAAPSNPMEISTIFDSECIKANEAQLGATCQEMLTRWRQWHAAHEGQGNHGHHQEPQHPTNPENTQPEQPNAAGPLVDLVPFNPTNEHPDDSNAGENLSNDDDDDDDGDKKHNNAFYEACHQDKQTLCPNLKDNVSPHDFFKAKCAHQTHLSPKCQHFYTEWRHTRMAIFGILISSTFATMFAGMLALMAICCCVACCVRRRRISRRRSRATKHLPTAQKAKSVDSQPLVVNAESADLEQQQNYFPMQNFPAGASFAPYSYVPTQQYWQPVMFTPEQFAQQQQQAAAEVAK